MTIEIMDFPTKMAIFHVMLNYQRCTTLAAAARMWIDKHTAQRGSDVVITNYDKPGRSKLQSLEVEFLTTVFKWSKVSADFN